MKRVYGLDLLKIISTFMIFILHILNRGGIIFSGVLTNYNYYLLWFIEIICYCSVDCYAIITGYLMVDKEIKNNKVINLWVSVLFWSVLITIIFKLLFPYLVGKKEIFKSFFPIIFNRYWYFSAYFMLYFFIPYLNILLKHLTSLTHKNLVVTIIIFSLLGIISNSFGIGDGYNFIWLMFCYIVGAYIKRKGFFYNKNTKKIILYFLVFIFVVFSFKFLIRNNPKITFELFDENLLVKYTSFPILFASICLVEIFLKTDINNKYLLRFIRKISPATFGAYIIHVHPVAWELFMKDRFKFLLLYNPHLLVIYVLGIAFCFYMLCSYLEMIRLFIFKKIRLTRSIEKLYLEIFNNIVE